MDKFERLELLEEAQSELHEVIRKVQIAVRGTSVAEAARGYVLASLAMCADDEHGYLGGQPFNLQKLIDKISEIEDDEPEEDELIDNTALDIDENEESDEV